MQLQSESNPSLNTITAYGVGYIEVNAVAYHHAIYLAPQGPVQTLPVSRVADISVALLEQMAGLAQTEADLLAFLENDDAAPARPQDAAQVVLIGTGPQQQFLPAALLHTLTRVGVGVETMTTQAAARTYNILMMEGRRVVAALFPL